MGKSNSSVMQWPSSPSEDIRQLRFPGGAVSISIQCALETATGAAPHTPAIEGSLVSRSLVAPAIPPADFRKPAAC